MSDTHFHIWKRQSFCLIAIPNNDKSFSVTLFIPLTKLKEIKTPKQLVEFFNIEFPDALLLMGKNILVEQFFKNKKENMVSFNVLLLLLT